ncbi:unnamed protein product [Clonostachys rosea]|uniref:Uncharacterized protein n=1 Tax=Bionectria ochroleuca TaxID=29856 RepID=A0ABY6V1H3_BIOOC|nr:unnamed protein product [Clonostachys rosea]
MGDEDQRDPTLPSLEGLSSGGHPFSIPWSHDVGVLLGGFKSSWVTRREGPWVGKGAFDTSGMQMTAIIPDTQGGSTSYKDAITTSTAVSNDHLSASLGITVGYPFLNASVTGEYDRTVLESHNAIRASLNASCRLGRIVLDQPPLLSMAAQTVLLEQGSQRFAEIYGDYYVAGYELGADAGASLFARTDSKSSEETLVITVTVKVLFSKMTLPPYTKKWQSSQSSSSICFAGYNTLGSSKKSIEAKDLSPMGLSELQITSAAYLDKVKALDPTARGELERLGLQDGQSISLSKCSEICGSGLVVQLLLAPNSKLIMAPPRYPVSTQWVTFPTDIESSVMIRWTENKLEGHQALYYKARCYWGDLPPSVENQRNDKNGQIDNDNPVVLPTSSGDINLVGVTTIYIAQEYIEKGYAGGLVKKYHIHDLAKAANKGKQVPPWVTMRLDAHFHYGQDGKNQNLRRWIVYHPSIIRGVPPPAMHQHRFTGLPKIEWLSAAAADAYEIGADTTTGIQAGAFLASKLGAKAIDMMASKFGDPLHQFLSQKEAHTVMYASTEKLKLTGNDGDLPPRIKQLIAVQIWEVQKIILDIKEAEKLNLEIEEAERQFQKVAKDYFLKNKTDVALLHKTLAADLERSPEQQADENARIASLPATIDVLNTSVQSLVRNVTITATFNAEVAPRHARVLINTNRPLVDRLRSPQDFKDEAFAGDRNNPLVDILNNGGQARSGQLNPGNNQSTQGSGRLNNNTSNAISRQINQGTQQNTQPSGYDGLLGRTVVLPSIVRKQT